MGKTKNIVPKDPYYRNLLESFIDNQKKILEGQQRVEQRICALEAMLCSPQKEKAEPEPFFTEKQLVEKGQFTRQTLYNYRKKGLLHYTKIGRTIRYTKADIDNLKKETNKH